MTSTKRHALPIAVCAALFSAVIPLAAQTTVAQTTVAQTMAAQTMAAQIARLNETLANAQTVSPQLAAVLTQRASLLSQLIAADPAQALQQALPPAIADRLRATAPPNSMETRGEFQGRMEATVADDFEHQRSETRHYLRTSTGPVEVFFQAQDPHPGDFVRISGLRLGDRMAVETVTPADPQTVIANTITAQASCTTLGPQKIAVIMLTMPSNPTFPAGWTTASLQEAFFGSPSDSSNALSLNGFWKEVSYGQTSAVGQVFGPFALTTDYDYSTQTGLQTEAINLADSTVDFSQFTRMALVFPQTSWGGAADDTVGCSYITSPSNSFLQLSTGWFPALPNSSPYIGTINHELGHALGLNHSSSDDYGAIPLGPLGIPGTFNEYGDAFATMGSNLGHYAAKHKSILHWLTPDAGYLEVTAPGTFDVLPYETTGNPRAIRILRDAATNAWLWLEYRQPIGDIDRSLLPFAADGNLFSGALVRYEDAALDDLHTYLLDFNPVSIPNNFLTNPALAPGTVWSDPNSLLTLTANSATSAGFNVTVSYDTPCATLQYSGTTFPATGGSGTVTVTAPSSCNWIATSNSAWLTIGSGASDTGNGTVRFSVAANTAANQQNAEITVQRQTTRVMEYGTARTVLSVNPAIGSGNSGQFTFQFDEASGYQNITEAVVNFGGYEDCRVHVSLSGKYLSLDTPSLVIGPLYLSSSGGTLSNDNCSVAASGSSITGSGTGAQVTLQMNFFSGFAGTHGIVASTFDSGGGTSGITLGIWTVPSVQQPGITITSNVVGAPFSLDGGAIYQSPATFYWSAGSQHTVAWLPSLASQPGSRYIFQSWADGGANPRTITAPAVSATYNAILQAQYKLVLTASPATAGGVAAIPASPDGYYNAGATVAVSGVASPGYTLWYLSNGSSTVTMSAPQSVTANFLCQLVLFGYPQSPIGAGPSQGIMQWLTAPSCAWTISSDSPWLTLTGAASGSGTSSVVWSVSPNTGASRTAKITLSSLNNSQLVTVTQEASTSQRPSVASIAPSAGSGLTQTFTLNLYDPSGGQALTDFYIQTYPSPSVSNCDISFFQSSGKWYAQLGGGKLSYFAVPDAITDSNGVCTIFGSTFLFSANGTSATASIQVRFAPAAAGTLLIAAGCSDSQNASQFTWAGQYTVTPSANTITFAPLPNITTSTTSFALTATASSGNTVAYTSSPTTVCTVSGSTVTILNAGGCTITATQPGDSTYAAATPVTQSFTILFGDIASTDHYYAAINAMAQHGITSGCGSNNFCPGENVTRDQMAIFLVRAIYGNDNFSYNTTPYFTDVPSGAFGFKWIQKMKDLGITSGCTATTYCPSGTVNRDQMAIFIIRARLGLALAGGQSPTFTYPSTPYFTDVLPGAFGYDWIQRMRLENITSGCTATTYCASSPIIRGDMAIFIMRGALNQFLPAGTPMLTQISPATLPLGTSGTYTITGTNTNFIQGTTQLSPIPGVTIGAITVTSPTALTVQLTASSTAVAQPYSLLAVTGTEEDVLPNGLVLQ